MFIAKPWSVDSSLSLESPVGPVAEGLSGVGLAGTPSGRLLGPNSINGKNKRKKKKKKGETKEDKERKMKRRKRRMLAEQEEYRQWRGDVRDGKISEEEDTFDAVLDEILNELF